MKILQVITCLGLGGAEMMLEDLVVCLKQKGEEVSVLTLMYDPNYEPKSLSQHNIKIIRCPENKKFSIRNIIFLIRHFRDNRYDIVNSHLTWDTYAMAIVNLLLGKKINLFYTNHSTVNKRRDNFFVKLLQLEKVVYAQCYRVICVAPEVYDNLIFYFPKLQPKCLVINNGINLGKFTHLYDAVVRQNEPVIVCVGSFREIKDQQTLIRAIEYVHKGKLWLLGDGVLRLEMERLVKERQLEDRVFFYGERLDVLYFLNRATIYVQPSKFEGLSIAVLEAMAAGLPVIASNVPGLRDLVRNVGILFSSGDAQELAFHINTLLADKGLLEAMSMKSKKCSEQYSIEITAAKYLTLYKAQIKL